MQQELNRFEDIPEILNCGFPKGNEKLTIEVKELAKILGIGINATYKLVKNTEFPSIKLGGQYKIVKSLLPEWLKNNTGKMF